MKHLWEGLSPVEFEKHIADTIRDYWSKRGYRVATVIQKADDVYPGKESSPFYSVKSDTINGMPRSPNARG